MNTRQSDGINRPGVTPYFEAQEFPPSSATIRPVFGADSRRGRFHTVNEDHYLILTLGRSQETILTSLPDSVIGKRFDERGFAMILADGLGNFGAGLRTLWLFDPDRITNYFAQVVRQGAAPGAGATSASR